MPAPPSKRARTASSTSSSPPPSAAAAAAAASASGGAGRAVTVEHRRHVTVQSVSACKSPSADGGDAVGAPPAIDTEAAAAGGGGGGCASLLEQLVWPMPAAEFMRDCFRKKAACTLFRPDTAGAGGGRGRGAAASAAAGPEPTRTAALVAALAGLELLPMLHESASEQIFVWMKPAGKRDGRIASFGVQQPEAAKVCSR
eukprot:SAG22_NODE_2645_length_2339_cov_7.678125_1_plen_200_part_00